MSISKKIRAKRMELGYSQKYMALELDIAQSNYSRFEKEGANITSKNLEKIAKVLGVEVSYFYNNSEDSNANDTKELYKLLLPGVNDGFNFYKNLYETQQKEMEGYKERIKLLESKIDAKDAELERLRSALYSKPAVTK